MRYRHQRGGHSLPREPNAEGNEQDERTEAGKRALSHRNRIYAGGFPVQVKLAVRRVPDLVIRNAR